MRTRDNASAYAFFVDIVVCNNTSGSFVAVPIFSASIDASEPLLAEIVSIAVVSTQQSPITSTAIELKAKVEFRVCLNPVNQANCLTYIHDFLGIASDRRGVAGGFSFTQLV